MLHLVSATGLNSLVLSASKRIFSSSTAEIEVTQLQLTLPHLSPAFDGYRLVHISDLHIGTWLNEERLAQAVELVNQQQPDLVAITGDFVTYAPERHGAALVRNLSRIQAADAKLAVLGNHDHWTDPYAVRRLLRNAGVHTLNNQVFSLRRNEARLHFGGVDDLIEKRAQLDRVLQALPEQGAAVLLAHEPDFADTSAASGRFDLQLSGHTHGGQIRLPRLGAPITPSYGRKYSAGLYRVGEMWQYTNRGLGTAELQVRINCPAEITVLTLQSPPPPGRNGHGSA